LPAHKTEDFMNKPLTKNMIEEWDGDGVIRIPDEALQELKLDVGETPYLIQEFVGNIIALFSSSFDLNQADRDAVVAY
jgi:hypothetical protein